MKLSIKGLTELRARLDQVRPAEVMAKALAEQAEHLAEAVRAGLSEPQGGGHDKPWLRTGALHDSITSTANDLEAAVGSNDPAAAPQEMGTPRIPPRPFLAPVAMNMGESVAQGIAEAVVAALQGDIGKESVVLVADTVRGRTQPVPFDPLGVFQPGSRENEVWARGTQRGIEALARELGRVFHTEQEPDNERAPRPPTGSKPIDQTPWSGDHNAIKDAIGAGATDNTSISPAGEVWSQNPDGSWTNYGPAEDYTGSGRASGRRGRDRR